MIKNHKYHTLQDYINENKNTSNNDRKNVKDSIDHDEEIVEI